MGDWLAEFRAKGAAEALELGAEAGDSGGGSSPPALDAYRSAGGAAEDDATLMETRLPSWSQAKGDTDAGQTMHSFREWSASAAGGSGASATRKPGADRLEVDGSPVRPAEPSSPISSATSDGSMDEPPKERYWAELEEDSREHARLLGWNERTWDAGGLDPFLTRWDELSRPGREAAQALGFSAADWDEGSSDAGLDQDERRRQEGSFISEDWLQQAASAANDPAPRRGRGGGGSVSPRRHSPSRVVPPRGSRGEYDEEQLRIEAVFNEVDSGGVGLVPRVAFLSRLRGDKELRLMLRLQLNARDGELEAFERVFAALDSGV